MEDILSALVGLKRAPFPEGKLGHPSSCKSVPALSRQRWSRSRLWRELQWWSETLTDELHNMVGRIRTLRSRKKKIPTEFPMDACLKWISLAAF